MTKPKEFWLTNVDDGYNGIYSEDPDSSNEWCSDKIHVIEYSAYEEAQQLAKVNHDLFIFEEKEKNRWYEEFYKLEISRASCCWEMEKERDYYKAADEGLKNEKAD